MKPSQAFAGWGNLRMVYRGIAEQDNPDGTRTWILNIGTYRLRPWDRWIAGLLTGYAVWRAVR